MTKQFRNKKLFKSLKVLDSNGKFELCNIVKDEHIEVLTIRDKEEDELFTLTYNYNVNRLLENVEFYWIR